MADIIESLKKITYESLQQFVEDINRNFAIIENSPLYKGIPGDEGEEGKKGLRGERGSKIFFIRIDEFIQKYPGEVSNLNAVNQVWINAQLTDLSKTNKLLELFNTTNFVDTDIIVLGNSRMIEYDAISNTFKDTGISFYQQNTLISSIENKIAALVKQYIDNNPKILSIKNLLIHYETYAKVYSSTSNSYISQEESDSSVLFPYFAGLSDTQGAKVPNHKYFGISDEEYPDGNKGSLIVGSVARFVKLLNATISTNERSTFSSDFAPNRNNIPTLIVLQDTDKNGIMLGYKDGTNITRFASIYKDYVKSVSNEYYDADRERHNLVLKSDQGVNPTDFSKLLINRYRLRYDKEVYFEDNLEVAKDFNLIGNIDNRFIRTAEKIKTKYISDTEEDKEIRSKTIEIGYNGNGSYQINISENIELPNFYEKDKTVVLTVERTNAALRKSYIVEEGTYNTTSNKNLDDLVFTPKFKTHLDYAFITTNQLLELIKKINYIQQYTKDNYYRIDEWETTDRPGNTNKTIPELNVGNIHIDKDKFVVYNDTRATELFSVVATGEKIILGTKNSDITLSADKVRFNLYDLTTHNRTKNNRQNTQLVTSNDSGNLTTGYFIGNSDVINNLIKIDSNFDSNANDKNTLVTLDTIGVLQNLLVQKFKNINDEYWKKVDYHTESGPNITVGKIPHIYVQDLLGGKRLILENNSFNKTEAQIKSTNLVNIVSTSIKLDSKTITLPQHKKQVLVTNPDGVLYQAEKDIYTIEDFTLPDNYGVKDLIEIKITDGEHHFLTSNYLVWLNNRINKIVENGLGDEYWKKVDFEGDDSGNYIIPTLNLKKSLNVTGNVTFYNSDKSSAYFRLENNILCLGHLESTNAIGSELDFLSKRIRLVNTDFYGKVLVTYKTADTNEDTDNESKSEGELCNNVVHKAGELRKDIEITQDSGLTQDFDNLVPISAKDTDGLKSSTRYKTKDKHKLLTGRTLKWIMGFMDAVKKRFADTFSKTETLQHMHDILPVGSIIMWTKISYDLACAKDPNFKGKKERKGIPNGWWPCNGTKIPGTNLTAPDMRNQFVRGVNLIENANGTHGRDKYKLKEGQLPNLKHTHGIDKDGSHTHLLTTKESDAAYYNGEFVYRNDVTSTETIRQKIGTGCDENAPHSEGSPILMPTGQAVKLKNLKVPVVVAQWGIVGKNNWINENMQSRWTGGGTEKSFQFESAITAGISLYDFVNNYLNGNSFEISNVVDGLDVSTHRHNIHEAGLGMSTETKQGWIYTVPSYYSVIYIMKYDNSVTTGDPIPDPIELVSDLPTDSGEDYIPPTPDQKEGSDTQQRYTIKVTINGSHGSVFIGPVDDRKQQDVIYAGDGIQLTAIPDVGYRFKSWSLGAQVIETNIIPDDDLYGQGTNPQGKVTIYPKQSCTYTAEFEEIPDEPTPPPPVEINPNINVNITASLDGYEASEINYIKYTVTGAETGVNNVNIELRK